MIKNPGSQKYYTGVSALERKRLRTEKQSEKAEKILGEVKRDPTASYLKVGNNLRMGDVAVRNLAIKLSKERAGSEPTERGKLMKRWVESRKGRGARTYVENPPRFALETLKKLMTEEASDRNVRKKLAEELKKQGYSKGRLNSVLSRARTSPDFYEVFNMNHHLNTEMDNFKRQLTQKYHQKADALYGPEPSNAKTAHLKKLMGSRLKKAVERHERDTEKAFEKETLNRAWRILRGKSL